MTKPSSRQRCADEYLNGNGTDTLMVMNEKHEVVIEAINFDDGVVVSSDDVGDVKSWMDENDLEVEPDLAVYAIVEWRGGGWSVVWLDEYEGSGDYLN